MPNTEVNPESSDTLLDTVDLRQWVHLVRIGVYLLVLLLAVVTNISQSEFTNWSLLKSFYFFSFVGLVGHIFELWKFDKIYKSRALLFISFVFDVVLITTLFAQTRLNDSLFLFMYMATILVGSLLSGIRVGFSIAGLCSIAYSCATLMGPEVKSLHIFFLMIVNNFGFFSMAWLGGRFSEDLESVEEKLNSSTINLESLRRIQSMIVDSVSSGLITTKSDGEILTLNPAAEKLFSSQLKTGGNINALWGISPTDVLSSEHQPFEKPFEVELQLGDDKKLLNIQKRRAGQDVITGTVVLWTVDDLTDSRRMEMSLRQSEKMAAVGHLSAGIAHEIRNPLTGISGAVEMFGHNTTKDEESRLKQIIMREINRLNNLITEFLEYAKPAETPKAVVSLPQIINECVEFLKPQSEGVEFKLNLAEAKILGDSQKLRQVFLNMVINSVQAMATSEKKMITISVQPGPEAYVTVKVRDSGCGIPDKVRNRIFEPFMTTKPKGTGLGLAMSHKILEMHRAKVFVESQVGEGTEFIMQFPLERT